MSGKRKHVVIVGGGFGGLAAARALRREPVRVTLLDRRNHHLFLPLLYQVATCGLNPGDIAAPIRRILRRQRNAMVLLGEVVAVDRQARRVRLADGGSIDYDYLILAAGARQFYFGNDGWSVLAPGLTTVEDALEIRRRLLYAYEAAEKEEDAGLQGAWLTNVVVGGGPTGVELAGAIAEMARHALSGEFRRINPRRSRVILVEEGDRILSGLDPGLSGKAVASLRRLGIEVRTSSRVTRIDATGVEFGSERIECRSVFWAAGVKASPLAESLEVPLDRGGRVPVMQDLTVEGSPDLYVIGDLAAVADGNRMVPGLAPAAVQQGNHAARNIAREIRGLGRRPFHYRDRGTLATIGRAAAVADLGYLRFSGYPAWLAWLAVHIVHLIGFRSRTLVLMQWAWAYLTYDRGVRLLTNENRSVGKRDAIVTESPRESK
jgi:NADH dehydrogenase